MTWRAARAGALAALAIVATLVGVVPPAQASGTSYTWSALGDGTTWGDSANWTPAGIPGDGDSVTVAPPDLHHCFAHVTDAPDGVTLAALDLEDREFVSGTVCQAELDDGRLRVSGQLTLRGGTLGTATTLDQDATGRIQPNVTDTTEHATIAAPMDVAGTLAITGNEAVEGDELRVAYGAEVTIEPGGRLESDEDTIVATGDVPDPEPALVNRGTLDLSGQLTLDIDLEQDGELDTHSGAFDRVGGLVTTGRVTSEDGASYVGPGYWSIANVATLGGTQHVGPGFQLDLTGLLDGAFTLSGAGELLWSGGTIGADMTVGPGFTVVSQSQDVVARVLYGRDDARNPVQVVNHGTIEFLGARSGYRSTCSSTLVNAADGTIVLDTGTLLAGGQPCSGIDDEGVILNRGGRVQINTLGAHPGGVTFADLALHDHGGTLAISRGSTLALRPLTNAAQQSFSDGAELTGGGTLDDGSPTAVGGTVDLGPRTTLLLDHQGTLDGTASIGGAGRFSWRAGSLSGELTLSPAGGSVIERPDSSDTVAAPKRIVATAHSSVRFATRTSIVSGTRGAPPDEVDLDTNAHLVLAARTLVGADVLLRNGAVLNTGGMTVTSTPRHPALFAVTRLVNAGTVRVARGALVAPSGYEQIAGRTQLSDGARLQVGSRAAVRLTGGVLGGRGVIAGDLRQTGGAVQPGSPSGGALQVRGRYDEGPAGSLIVRVAARLSTLLRLVGDATLRGRLEVDGSAPPGAVTRTVLTATGRIVAHLGCVTTEGPGASGPGARHWSPVPTVTRLGVRSRPGPSPSC